MGDFGEFVKTAEAVEQKGVTQQEALSARVRALLAEMVLFLNNHSVSALPVFSPNDTWRDMPPSDSFRASIAREKGSSAQHHQITRGWLIRPSVAENIQGPGHLGQLLTTDGLALYGIQTALVTQQVDTPPGVNELPALLVGAAVDDPSIQNAVLDQRSGGFGDRVRLLARCGNQLDFPSQYRGFYN